MKDKNTAWILLIAAGLLEIVWAYTMKLSHGFTVLWPSVITIIILIVSFSCSQRRWISSASA